MSMSNIQQTYLALACASVFALGIIVGQVLYKAGSISVSSRASFVTAASMVLAVRAASFYMAMGHEQEQQLSHEVAEITAADRPGTPDLLAAASKEQASSFAADWTMVLNLDWGGVCFLAAMLTHVSSLLRSALAARTLDRYGVLKRVFCNQNGITAGPTEPVTGPASGRTSSINARGAARTSSGGYSIGAALDSAPGTVGSGSTQQRREDFRGIKRGSSHELDTSGESGGNPYRPRKAEVRGNLLLPTAHSAVSCCTPRRIGTTLGAAMAVILVSYFGVTLGYFFSRTHRQEFQDTIIPTYFCVWFTTCCAGLGLACYLHADSGALVLHRPAPQGHCTPWLLCCTDRRGQRFSYASLPDQERAQLSIDSILKRTRWCGALKGYPLSHRARHPLWAGTILCAYSGARAVITLLLAMHDQGAMTRSESATAAVYFGSEILVILLVCQVLMPLVSSGPFDTTDAEFVLALFRNMRLRESVVQDVAQVFADVPAVARTVANLPQADVNRLHVSMQRQFLRVMGNLQDQLREVGSKVDAQAVATRTALHSDQVAAEQRAGEIMDALAAQQEEFREWAEDTTGTAPGMLGDGGFLGLEGGFGPGPGALQARLTGGGGGFQGGDLRLPPLMGGSSGAYNPPAVPAVGHSYVLAGAQLPTVPSPVMSMRSSGSTGTLHSHRASDSSGGGGGEPPALGSPTGVGGGLGGPGHPGSTDRSGQGRVEMPGRVGGSSPLHALTDPPSPTHMEGSAGSLSPPSGGSTGTPPAGFGSSATLPRMDRSTPPDGRGDRKSTPPLVG